MTNRIATAAAALVLGVASITAATAAPRPTTWTGYASEAVGSVDAFGAPLGGLYGRNPHHCAMSSAAEGNAAQQNRPVMQYGQTSGGNRC